MIGLSFVLALQVATPPSLAEIQRLSPGAAGELALGHQTHGPIESIVRGGSGMDAPGMIRLDLVERPVAQEGGCSRKRWHLDFFPGPDGIHRLASQPSSRTEVALSSSGVCPQGQYVQLNSALTPERAFDALRHLDEIRSPRGRARFSCTDRESTHLCSGSRAIRRELARLSPWAVMTEGDATIFWMGTRGDIVTEVRYRAASPDRVVVKREMPAPF